MVRFLKLGTLTALLAAFSVSGCDEATNVNFPPEPENSPPKILLSGPDITPGSRFEGPVPTLWVAAGDPDGANDIAAVFLHVDSITLNSVIVRPDSAPEPCRIVNYSDNDTVNVMPLLTTTIFTIDLALSNSYGVYGRGLGYSQLIPGGLVNYAVEFGRRVKDCSSGLDYGFFLETFGLYPPALPAPRDVHVTYVDLSLEGIAITVYDQSGATATKTFPDLEVYFTNPLEEATLP